MEKSRKRKFWFHVSYLHLLVLAYCLVLSALFASIAIEKQRAGRSVSMTRAAIDENRGSTALLSLHGDGMHDNVHILHAADTVDDRAFQWEILSGTSVRAVAAEGQIALVGCFLNKLVSVDLSTPGEPTILDSLELPDYINDIRILDKQALVGMTRGSGMAIIDLSDPKDLELSALIPSNGVITDMATAGEHIYFADINRGFGRINLVAESPTPEILDTLNKPWRVAIADNRLVVASLDNRLYLYNLSRGGKIDGAGSTQLSGLEKGGIRGVSFVGKRLAVAISDGSLRIFPLRSWPTLKDYTSLPIPGVPYGVMPIPGQDRMAVSLVSAGMALVDIDSSGDAVVSGHLMLPSTIVDMEVQGDMVYASRQPGHKGLAGFTLEDVEQSSPSPATHVDRDYYDLHAWNGRIFGYGRDKALRLLADKGRSGVSTSGPILTVHGEDGVSMFRMSEHGEVSAAEAIVVEGGAIDAVYHSGSLYVLHRKGLRILTVAESAESTVVGELEVSGRPVHLKFLKPGMMLITTRSEGVKVVDVSDRGNPLQIAKVSPPRHLQSSSIAQDILINGQLAYVSQGMGGVYVIDLGDPEYPELLQVVDTPGMARKMVLHENLLLVADGDEGIYMMDAGRPDRLLPIGSLPTPLRANEIAVVPDGILISSHPGGTLKLPLPKKLKDYRFVSGEVVQGEISVARSGGYAYLYDEGSHSRVPLEPPVNQSRF